MKNEIRRLADRFQPLFDNGLTNVKFFVPHADNCTLSELVLEANKIQDTIAAGDFRVVESIDGNCERKPFDAAF